MTLAPHGERCADAYGGPPPGGEDGFEQRVRPAPEDAATIVPAFVPVPSYDEDVSDKPTWLSSRTVPLTPADLASISEQYTLRLRSLLSVDRMLGRLVNALGERLDETVLVFTSDNGWLYGEHRVSGKIYSYRESAQVPLYIAVPGGESGERANLVVNNDLLPTLLDLAAPGYVDPLADGRSLVPLLRAIDPPGWVERRHFLVEFGRTNDATSRALWPTYFALRSTTKNYVESYDGTWYLLPQPPLIGLELYDLVTDPYETTSLMRHPENARDPALGQHIDLLRTCSGAACRALEDAAPAP
jgi:hypothetical protein